MKIGLIAMSGVRASSEELNQIGLTLPGFVERSRVIASLPSLSLLTLAALTPPQIEIEYQEVRDLAFEGKPSSSFDLVAISSYSAQIEDAYRLSDAYNREGVPTILGGLHVTALPGEAMAHCTSVVLGEAELLWEEVIEDFVSSNLKETYQTPPGKWFDLSDSRVPRYDLLDTDAYNRLTVQTSRGCPFRCDFCASSVLLTPKYRVKPSRKVIEEIRAIKHYWPHPFIEFADDNSFVQRAHYKDLLTFLKEERVHWFTECDISIAEDPDLLDLMRESGCRQVLIGLESPCPDGVQGIELKSNWKFSKSPHYEDAIRVIQDHGITVDGCFILGLDGDGEEVFDGIYAFVERTGLFEVQLTVLTPFPGTPLYDRLKHEGRIIEDRAWRKCTLFDVNFVPRRMSPERLQQGLVDLARRVYQKDFIKERRQRFFDRLRGLRGGVPAVLEEVERDAYSMG
ncbi:MAG: hypothetical protein GHCLOJNM_00544 [bacterium]|nr:hypothetical protein [bacterium]